MTTLHALDPWDVEDVKQEAATRALTQTFVDAEHHAKWTHVVSRRLSSDVLRRRHRHVLVSRFPDRADLSTDPADIVARQQAVSVLVEALGSLPQDLSDLLWRHHVEEVDAHTLADEYGVTHAAMRKRLQRARGLARHEYVRRGGPLALFAIALPDLGRIAKMHSAVVGIGLAAAVASTALMGPMSPFDHTTSVADAEGAVTAQASEDHPAAGMALLLRQVSSTSARAHEASQGGNRGVVMRTIPPVDTGSITVGPVHTDGGVRVEQNHKDETFQETVQRCVDKGVHVDPYRIECND